MLLSYNLAAAVSFGCYFAKDGNFAWRFPLALQCLFPAILFGLTFTMPESPRYLLLKDRSNEAREVMLRLHSTPGDVDDDFAKAEFNLMAAQIQLELTRSGGASASFLGRWMYLFSKKSYVKRAILGFSIMFGCQLTGCECSSISVFSTPSKLTLPQAP